jgi:hypothetical protein
MLQGIPLALVSTKVNRKEGMVLVSSILGRITRAPFRVREFYFINPSGATPMSGRNSNTSFVSWEGDVHIRDPP